MRLYIKMFGRLSSLSVAYGLSVKFCMLLRFSTESTEPTCTEHQQLVLYNRIQTRSLLQTLVFMYF